MHLNVRNLATAVIGLTLNVELTERHKQLRLLVSDAGDGNKADHAD